MKESTKIINKVNNRIRRLTEGMSTLQRKQFIYDTLEGKVNRSTIKFTNTGYISASSRIANNPHDMEALPELVATLTEYKENMDAIKSGKAEILTKKEIENVFLLTIRKFLSNYYEYEEVFDPIALQEHIPDEYEFNAQAVKDELSRLGKMWREGDDPINLLEVVNKLDAIKKKKNDKLE